LQDQAAIVILDSLRFICLAERVYCEQRFLFQSLAIEFIFTNTALAICDCNSNFAVVPEQWLVGDTVNFPLSASKIKQLTPGVNVPDLTDAVVTTRDYVSAIRTESDAPDALLAVRVTVGEHNGPLVRLETPDLDLAALASRGEVS
jgi:hypothetical protein